MTRELPLATLLGSLVLALVLPAAVAAQGPGKPPPQKAPLGAPSDRYYVYQLNHISKLNAIEVLKTLNYEVASTGIEGTGGGLGRPVVIELPDSATTSLVKAKLSLSGLNPLKAPATGVPQQRLLIVWDAADPGSLESLLGLLYERIDVPARQILIEALFLELDRNWFKDLGISFTGTTDGHEFTLPSGFLDPFTFVFNSPKAPLKLQVTVAALVRDGIATILSQPSVLVLDGRQARIHIGDKIPYTDVTASQLANTQQIVSTTKWAEVGITLNLLPRATEDGSEITMQVEALITAAGKAPALTNAISGPPISSREVQTIVRVANDTPFVIGGLISETESDQRSGVPFLSKIPGLGKLFRKRERFKVQKEVIVVITPHIIPLEDRAFSYSVTQDTKHLDQFGLTLFRDVYRVRSDDIFDLDFILKSDLYRTLRRVADRVAAEFARRAVDGGWAPVAPGDKDALARQMRRAVEERPDFLKEMPELEAAEPLIELFEERIPGEDILVKRMLLGIIEKLDYGRHVDREKITFFEGDSASGGTAQPILQVRRLFPRLRNLGKDCRTLRLVFETRPPGSQVQHIELAFDPPTAIVDDSTTLRDDAAYLTELRRLNRRSDEGAPHQQGVLLNECYRRRGQTTLKMLRNVLALKRLLEVNPSLALTLDDFHAGRRLVFPAAESLKAANHVLDRQTAALFYEAMDYYYAFEQAFGQAYRSIEAQVERHAGDPGSSAPPESDGNKKRSGGPGK